MKWKNKVVFVEKLLFHSKYLAAYLTTEVTVEAVLSSSSPVAQFPPWDLVRAITGAFVWQSLQAVESLCSYSVPREYRGWCLHVY